MAIGHVVPIHATGYFEFQTLEFAYDLGEDFRKIYKALQLVILIYFTGRLKLIYCTVI